MFDRFKKLLNIDSKDDAPVPEDLAAPRPVRRTGGHMDKVTLSGASSVAIPDASAGDALVSGTPVESVARQAPRPMTLGLRELMRAKPMQHFILLADGIEENKSYRYHDLGGRYYEVFKSTFPALDRFTSLTFWGFNFQGDHRAQIRILDVDDNVIAELAEPYRFRLERPSDTHETRTAWQVLFPKPGTYHIVVETDGRPTAVAPIFVSRTF